MIGSHRLLLIRIGQKTDFSLMHPRSSITAQAVYAIARLRAHGIRNLLRYGIIPKGVWNQAAGMHATHDAIPLRGCHTRLRVIPCQACGLDKKIDKRKLVDFLAEMERFELSRRLPDLHP